LPPGITLNSDGTFSGSSTVPDVYSFSVTATDNGSPNESSNPKAYEFTIVEASNDAPIASVGTGLFSRNEGASADGLSVAGDFSDEEDDTLTYMHSGTLPPGITLNSDGTFSSSSRLKYIYVFSFKATVSGSHNESSNPKAYEFTNVEASYDAPIASV